MNECAFPKVTVVTVVLNDCEHIEQTIQSVIAQTYPNVEYVLVDGASSDGTLDVIRRYQSHFAVWQSQPDAGIYNAMNQAVGKARGEWVIFINSGDLLADSQVLETIFSAPLPPCDFIYGPHLLRLEGRDVLCRPRPLKNLWRQVCFSHQSLFSRRELLLEKPFDERFRIAADYDFYFAFYQRGARFHAVESTISVMRDGGISSQHLFLRTLERWRAARRYEKHQPVHRFYLWHLLREGIVRPALGGRSVGVAESVVAGLVRGLVRARLELLRAQKGPGVRIALFGNGEHTAWLLPLIDQCGLRGRVAVILDDRAEAGERRAGIPVHPPSACSADVFDVVIPSTDTLEARFIQRIAAVYGARTEVWPLYAEVPGGPYPKD